MKLTLHSIYYETLKKLITFSIRRFYGKVSIDGYRENVPVGEPVIFVGNHQNALIDALNIVCSTGSNHQPSFLTRSDVFTSATGKILYSFKMLPIYRQRDGVDTLKLNEQIFQECVNRLSKKDSLIIFAEGNHNRQLRIRPLKKGAARIAFMAEEANDMNLGIKFVPVGLNYKDHIKFRSDFYIRFGKPIAISDFYESYQKNPQRTLITITQQLRERMKEEVIHIPNRDHYEAIEGMQRLFAPEMAKKMGLNPAKAKDEFVAAKKIVDILEEKFTEPGEKELAISEKVIFYLDGLKKLRMRDHVFARAPYSPFGLILTALGLLALLPVHLYGVINNYIPYKIPEVLALRLFRDDHFHSSIKAAVATFIFPIFYLLQTAIVWGFTDWKTALIYLISISLAGRFAIWYSNSVKKWHSRWRFMNLNRKGDQLLSSVRQAREEFIGYLREVTDKAANHFSGPGNKNDFVKSVPSKE